MKLTKRIICLLLAIATVCSLCIGSASAASTAPYDGLSSSKYARVYTLATSGKVIPYTNQYLTDRGTVNSKSSSAYIDCAADELRVFDVGETNGKYWAKVSYPITGKSTRRTAYIHLSDITANTHAIQRTSTGKFLCAPRKDSAISSSYYVAKGDQVWLLAVSGSRVQIMYPAGSVYRIAWANKSDFEKYCGSIADQLVDVTAQFAGKTITLQSVENGKYLCADSNASGTPLRANKDQALTWERLNIRIVGDQTQEAVRSRMDAIANGSLSYNSSTVMRVGSRFTGYRASEQCKGYAKNVFYLCFGITPGSTQSKNAGLNYLLSSTKGMTKLGSVTSMTASNISGLFANARPGDFVQMRRSHGGSHSAIVYSVSASGVTFLEANLDGKNTVSMNYYTWSTLCSKNAAMSVYTASNYTLK